METYSADDIMRLISCKKKTVQPPKKGLTLERGSFRNDMQLESEDGKEKFSVFLRKNQEFAENFSIGLRYHPRDGQSFNLFRCNGPHGLHVDLEIEPDSHYAYHVHEAQADRVNEGNLSERHVTVTDKYASYEEALNYFIKAVGITDAAKHFPEHVLQLPLIRMDGE
jgi:hypothetical protein